MSTGLSRWPRTIVTGYWRSAVLVAVAGLIPCLTVAVAIFGTMFALSWTAALHTVFVVSLAAHILEVVFAAWWTVIGFSIVMTVLGRPTAEFLRRCAGRWLGVAIPSPYRPRQAVTKMSTGYWWDGHTYHETKRRAQFQAWLMERSVAHALRRQGLRVSFETAKGADPHLRRDVVWQVAATAVVAVAALPVLFAAGAIYAAAAGPALLALVLVLASIAAAPAAWKVFSPLGLRYLAPSPHAAAEEEVARLSSIRADLTQTQAAELERIERSLHDGAQARIVALGMHLSAAERLVDTDPEQAKQILRDARASTRVALEQLRSLVRGINPPVLAERGLAHAIRAIALDTPVEVDVTGTMAGRPERPVEAALYFAVAELLTNVVKHAHATRAAVEISHTGGVLRVVVSDNGTGGAAGAPGSGLDGIDRRMAAFEGRLDVDSPAGGPTRVTVTVPCELS